MGLTNRKKCEITKFFINIIDVPRGMDHGWPDIKSIVKFQPLSVKGISVNTLYTFLMFCLNWVQET